MKPISIAVFIVITHLIAGCSTVHNWNKLYYEKCGNSADNPLIGCWITRCQLNNPDNTKAKIIIRGEEIKFYYAEILLFAQDQEFGKFSVQYKTLQSCKKYQGSSQSLDFISGAGMLNAGNTYVIAGDSKTNNAEIVNKLQILISSSQYPPFYTKTTHYRFVNGQLCFPQDSFLLSPVDLWSRKDLDEREKPLDTQNCLSRYLN